MRMLALFATVLVCATAIASASPTTYHLANTYVLGGDGGWDYLAYDATTKRLFVSRGTHVMVVDPSTGKVTGDIPNTPGVHGIAVAPEFNKGFISNGKDGSVTVFDLTTLATLATIQTGAKNPDGIAYDPASKRVFTFNGRSNDSTAIDAKTLEIAGTFKLGGRPEFCVVDGAGKIYDNLEDTSEVIEIDAAKLTVLRRASLAPGDGPSGLAIDVKNKKLFSVCSNKMMPVTDIATMKVIATPAIGAGPDAAGFDPGAGLAFSSNGDATLTIVKLVNGKYDVADTVTTVRGARTMTVDEKLHRVYLLAAEYGPTPEAKDGKKGRPPVLPDSFHILVVGK